MARKKYTVMKQKKLQPAVLSYELTVPTGTSYTDLSLNASILNRRGYSQQYKYAVAAFELLGNGTGTFVIGKLPETWVYENAYRKARAMWNEMQDQVLENEEGIQGKYHDFKVYMDAEMCSEQIQCQATPGGKILTPVDENGNLTSADFTGGAPPRADWDWSTIQIPNDPTSGVTTEYTLHGVGPATTSPNSKGIIEGYARSRSRPQEQEPNVPLGEGWMNDLFDDGEQLEEIRDDLVNDNDRPPYAMISAGSIRESYPGGSEEQPTVQIHSFCNFTATTVSGKNNIMGGIFQNGLLKFKNNTEAAVNVLVHMVPGEHRGYMCERM